MKVMFCSLSRLFVQGLFRRVLFALTALSLLASALLTPATARASGDIHIVRAGETLAVLALYYEVDLDELIRINDIENPDLVPLGAPLILPGTKSANPYGHAAEAELPADNGLYTVQAGDSLSVIAAQHDLLLADLMRLNGITSPNQVWVGQQLRVTARAEVMEAAELDPAVEVDLAVNEIYIVKAGDSLLQIAAAYDTSSEALLSANGLTNANMIYPGQRLRVPELPTLDSGTLFAGAPADGERLIEIDLSDHTLTAWQGDVRIMYTDVTTGNAWTPTVKGDFAIDRMYRLQRMYGEDYDIPNVPWVMYFHGAYAIHGAYWRTTFGGEGSHGCINMSPQEAQVLFDWVELGTPVIVHD